MPSRQNLQSTLNWCGAFINYQPLTIGGVEPAVSIANIVLQTILGPPFCWRFNRASVQFECTPQTAQDYTIAVADFGFIEKAWIVSPDLELKEIQNKTVLSAEVKAERPHSIAVQNDDDDGKLTFRLMPVPDKAYKVNVLYQKKPRLMNSLASTWAPVPEHYGYIYQWGFLALASLLTNDQRFPIFSNKFTAHLLGAQDGLDEMQRNIFLGNWLEITREAARASMKPQQGVAARQQ